MHTKWCVGVTYCNISFWYCFCKVFFSPQKCFLESPFVPSYRFMNKDLETHLDLRNADIGGHVDIKATEENMLSSCGVKATCGKMNYAPNFIHVYMSRNVRDPGLVPKSPATRHVSALTCLFSSIPVRALAVSVLDFTFVWIPLNDPAPLLFPSRQDLLIFAPPFWIVTCISYSKHTSRQM